jgi:hypothetical protein
MNFGTTQGLNREGDKLQMIKKSVEDEINNPKNQLSLNSIFYKFKPLNKEKITKAKKNKVANKNNSPYGF